MDMGVVYAGARTIWLKCGIVGIIPKEGVCIPWYDGCYCVQTVWVFLHRSHC